jgi:hypothetical protein
MPEVVYTIVDEADNRVIDQFLETYQGRDCCRTFIRPDIQNPKGHTAPQRFIDIMSDPNNLYIIRCKDAGKIEDGSVILHNGLKVSQQGYYGDFSSILVTNGGCHEPAEERMFQEVLNFIPNNGCMIELGSYWAFYSLWFNKHVNNARNYCIEPSREALQVGIDNCKRNGVTNIDFTEGFIGANAVRVSEFVKDKKIDFIDILHSDIQGYEMEMLTDIVGLLKDKKIRYIFISTHSDDLHTQCLTLLTECDYRIIAQADFETETFCYDGILVACHKDTLEIPYTDLGVRKHTPLRTWPLYPIAEDS